MALERVAVRPDAYKLFGLYVQEQTYNLMLWMLPVSLSALVTAILWVAYV